ncbi:MAG: hypothetical protein QXO70_03500, partial [Candidatus Pacearchaeota archaeon]
MFYPETRYDLVKFASTAANKKTILKNLKDIIKSNYSKTLAAIKAHPYATAGILGGLGAAAYGGKSLYDYLTTPEEQPIEPSFYDQYANIINPAAGALLGGGLGAGIGRAHVRNPVTSEH